MSKLNYRLISYLTGLLLIFNSGAILLTTIVSYIYSDGFFLNIFKSFIICFTVGGLIMFFSKNPSKIINRKS